MLHAGIGESHVNNLLSALNVPGIHQKSLKRREREAGKGLEPLTEKSVSDALVLEISKTQERSVYTSSFAPSMKMIVLIYCCLVVAMNKFSNKIN